MTPTSSPPIAVLGAGSWGTALALVPARNGREVLLWSHDPRHVAEMAAARRNPRFLSQHPFPAPLQPIAALEEAVAAAGDLLLAVPSSAFRSVLTALQPALRPGQRLAWATKGLEVGSGLMLHEVAGEVLGSGHPLAVLSGPSFAGEVAAGQPTAVTVASADAAFADDLAATFHSGTFRAYTHRDVTGVELGGAVKNVLAIAAGIADGLGYGANTRAALITRGLAELSRFGVAMGGEPHTFMGLAGLGDLVLTATDNQSRNRRLGLALARGLSLQQALEEIGQAVEGVPTARVVTRRAVTLGVEMPICEQVRRVLDEGLKPKEAVKNLLAREQKAEWG